MVASVRYQFSSPRLCASAHNILDRDTGWASEVIVAPGQNSDHPAKTIRAVACALRPEYAAAPVAYHLREEDAVPDMPGFLHDYALLELDKEVFACNPVFPFVAKDGQLDKGDVHIIGYPGKKPTGTMWESKGPLLMRPAESNFLFYRISTQKGNSGSAVLKEIDQEPRIVGVHVGGSTEEDANWAVRITAEVFDKINSWLQPHAAGWRLL